MQKTYGSQWRHLSWHHQGEQHHLCANSRLEQQSQTCLHVSLSHGWVDWLCNQGKLIVWKKHTGYLGQEYFYQQSFRQFYHSQQLARSHDYYLNPGVSFLHSNEYPAEAYTTCTDLSQRRYLIELMSTVGNSTKSPKGVIVRLLKPSLAHRWKICKSLNHFALCRTMILTDDEAYF